MGIFICKQCGRECKNLLSLRSHSVQKHNISAEEVYLDYVLNGERPKCKCGCGEYTSFVTLFKGYRPYIQSHHNRVKGNNNFHKNPETHRKAIETQKKNWKEGKYKGWWEDKSEETLKKIEGIKEKLRNDKERAKKISNALKGRPKSEESKIKLSKIQKKRYADNPKLRAEAAERRVKWLKSKLSSKKTKIESKFELILILLGVKYKFQYDFKGKLFDFYLDDFNCLIEVDGDFYHCNPNSKHNNVIYEVQKLTKSNDDYKNKLCSNHNITLIRYWEKDINERPDWVISDLKQKLSL
jgi:very-short-patch-repair endonuclease